MKKNRFFVGLIMAVLLMMFLAACDSTTGAQRLQAQTVNTQQTQYDRNQPIPSFDYSVERDAFIQIYKFRVNAISTYSIITYPMATGQGALAYECPSIGYPIPADTQLTNPVVAMGDSYQGSVIDQAEPNGLFSSKNTVGTWVLCVLQDGTVYPVYTELSVTAFPFPVTSNNGMNITPAQGAKPSGTIDLQK